MAKVILPIWNDEMNRSLVYCLERKLPHSVRLTLNSDERSIAIEGMESTELTLDEFSEWVSSFFGESSKILNRLGPTTLALYKSVGEKDSGENQLDLRSTPIAGVYWLGPDSYQLHSLFDQVFLRFAVQNGAVSVQASSLITVEDLKKCGYHPRDIHQLSFLGTKKAATSETVAEDLCLSPAACLTTYPVLKGTLLTNRTAFTLLGHVFRREGGVFSPTIRPLERVREFQVRELIFFGDTAFREEIKRKYFDFLESLGRALDFSFEISTATDLFFHPEYSEQAVHQLIHQSKFEFKFLDAEEAFALSSFNIHENKFINAFELKSANKNIQSFCIGFGLQRWLQASLLRYGSSKFAEKILKKFLNTWI